MGREVRAAGATDHRSPESTTAVSPSRGEEQAGGRRREWCPDVALWAEQWATHWTAHGAGPGSAPLPESEALSVVDAVLTAVRSGPPGALEQAGRAWGRAHRSAAPMVARLTSLREVLTARDVDAVADPVVVHRAVDRVTAAAAEEVLRRSERASRTDPLTGAGNRRAFDEAMRSAVSAAARQGHEVTLAVIDLDGLKAINDTEGHGAGDDALVRLVGALRGAVRHEDAVFRVGGDEFVVLLPFTSVPAAGALLERVARTGAPAFTWGAAGFPRHGSDAASVVAAADRDLYRRRRAGRGRPSAVGATARVTPWRRAWPASIAAALAVGAVVAVAVLGAWAPRAHPVSALPQGRPPVAPASPGRAGSAVAPAPPSGQPTDALTAVGGAAPAHAVVTGASGPPRTGQGPVGAPAGSATGAAGSGAGTTTAPAPSLPPATPAPPGAPGGSTAVPTDPPGSAGGVVGAVQALVAAVPVPGANSVGTVLAQVLTGAPAPAVTAGAPTLPSALLPAGGGI